MKIRVGSSISGNKIKSQRPNNYNYSKRVNDRIDNILPIVNERHNEAHKTDGSVVYLFNKARKGRVCSCQKHEYVKNVGESLNRQVFSTESDTHLANNVESSTVDEIPSHKNTTVFRVRGFGNNSKSNTSNNENDAFTDIINNDLSSVRGDIDDEREEFHNEDPLNDIMDMAEFDEDDDGIYQNEVTSSLHGGERTLCGICLGSGFVNSYSLYGGLRTILDASHTVPFELNNSAVESNDLPNSFELFNSEDSSVIWHYNLPTYYSEILAILPRNNNKPAYGLDLQAREFGSVDWFPLTKQFLLDKRGTNKTISIRAVKRSDNVFEKVKFTHIEIYFRFTDNIILNMVNLNKSLDYNEYDIFQTVNIEVPGYVTGIERESVLLDTKFNRAWHVIEVEPRETANNQNFGYNVSMRLIQQDEAKYLLNLIRGQQIEISYPRSQERRQGDYIQK